KQRLHDWLKQARPQPEAAARAAKVNALKASQAEKALLQDEPNSPQARELAKKFAKELKVEDKDLRPFFSDPERHEWDALNEAVQTLERRKPKPLPAALAFADFSPKPHQTFLLARGDFRAQSEPVELGFLSVLTRNKAPEDYWAAA